MGSGASNINSPTDVTIIAEVLELCARLASTHDQACSLMLLRHNNNNNNNNNNTLDNDYGAVIMTQVIPVHLTNVGQRQVAADPPTSPTDLSSSSSS